MKYTLKPYQEVASHQILEGLDKANELRAVGMQASFALCAPTGAGKTVVATDVFEKLLLPSDDRVPDEKAVVIWFSDNPDLNRQSRHRIEGASSGLEGRTVEIENGFSEPLLRAGRIYFLNMQKLSKGSILTGGKRKIHEGQQVFATAADDVQITIWDVLRNTLTSEDHRVYFVVDEAHRGAARQARERETILQRLIAGHVPEGDSQPVPPMPVVVGISATPGRFKAMMQSMPGAHANLEDVNIPVDEVQESGLLKDIVELQIPGEEGSAFEHVFVQQAAELLAESTKRWASYHLEQGWEGKCVKPLMVVQMPDKASPEDLYRVIQAVRKGFPELPDSSYAHVFGEHSPIQAGDVTVPYQEPQSVQDQEWIRVLFAKTAISTGWDCPRAEVMVSFRPAQDKDHITQVIGRMVRSPLARRIPGDALLNSVLCLLPRFNRAAAEEVVQGINSSEAGGEGSSGGGVVDPDLLLPIDNQEVWEVFQTLPREIVPKRSEKPVSRLINVGIELERDGAMPDGQRLAQQVLISMVDGLLGRFHKDKEKEKQSIIEVETTRLTYRYADRGLAEETSVTLQADQRVIKDAYERAIPTYTRALAILWVDHYVQEHSGDEDEADEATVEAYLELASLAGVEGVREALWADADRTAKKWLEKHRADIAVLTDERRARYTELLEMATEPSTVYLQKPKNRLEAPGKFNPGTKAVEPYPDYDGMILTREDGTFPGNFNDWEKKVLDKELKRPNAVAWYRNPSHPGTDVLSAAYYDEGRARWRSVQPDFIFFRRNAEGQVRPEIVDPHGIYLGDALGKTQALARFAETYGDQFMRIETIAGETTESLKVLDLKNPAIREAVLADSNIQELYKDHGQAYE